MDPMGTFRQLSMRLWLAERERDQALDRLSNARWLAALLGIMLVFAIIALEAHR